MRDRAIDSPADKSLSVIILSSLGFLLPHDETNENNTDDDSSDNSNQEAARASVRRRRWSVGVALVILRIWHWHWVHIVATVVRLWGWSWRIWGWGWGWSRGWTVVVSTCVFWVCGSQSSKLRIVLAVTSLNSFCDPSLFNIISINKVSNIFLEIII